MVLQAQERLSIQITKTSDGQFDYLQILSGDQFALNIVLVAKRIDVTDLRTTPKKGK